MYYEFDTSIYPIDQRLGLWSDEVARAGPCSIAAITSVGFHGRVKLSLRNQITVFDLNLGGVVETRTKKDVAYISPEDLYLSYPLAGAFWLDRGGVERTFEPGQICLRSLAVPERVAVVAIECMCLKIPAAPLQQRLPILNPLYEITKAADPMRYNLLASFLDYFGGNLHQWGEDEFSQLSAHLYDLISLLILKPNASSAEDEMSVRIAHRERALAYIRTNLANPTINPTSVAEACGISVRYLYEIFKMANLGVEGCILDERVNRSRTLLNDARYLHVPVSTIGQMVGFKYTSHFVRSFHRRFGVTPGNFRCREQTPS
jgi:AraC-like DNA-binding protein